MQPHFFRNGTNSAWYANCFPIVLDKTIQCPTDMHAYHIDLLESTEDIQQFFHIFFKVHYCGSVQVLIPKTFKAPNCTFTLQLKLELWVKKHAILLFLPH